MQPDTQTRAFLSALHQGGMYSYWWSAEGRQSFWWETQRPGSLPNGKRNVYVGVHPTGMIPTVDRHGKPVESRSVRSQIATIAAVNCFFAEYDAKDFDQDKTKTLAHIQSLKPAPSVIIDSGGGYHCYWLLSEPWVLAQEDRERARKLQAAWVRLMGGDEAAKDLARVLRVPGTHNYKYTPARDVVFVQCNLEQRYAIDELAALAAPFVESGRASEPTDAPTNQDAQLQQVAARWLGNAVAKVKSAPDGKKHETLLDAAVTLGGFVPLNLLTEHEIESSLFAAVETRAEDAKGARDTIRDGIEYGKVKPWKTADLLKGKAQPHNTVATQERKVARPTEYIVDKSQHGITAAELFYKHFEPLFWTVENIMPESTVLLAGKPKSRKSWFALAIACACAMAGKALGRLNVRTGTVLYLDLESNQRRAKSRLFSIVGRAMAKLANLHIYTKWGRGVDAIAQLEDWMLEHPDTVLVVIDVLADFRRGKDPKEDAYLYDRETVGPITEFADRHRITVLLVHHTRKAKADDVFDEISGSTGLISAVGTALILGRAPNGTKEMVLDLRGRDLVNDEPLALEWDDYTCQHIIVGGAVDAKLGAERRAVLQVLADDQAWTPKDIATELEKSVNSVQLMLKELLSEGHIERTGYGKYVRVLTQSTQNEQSTQSTQNGQSILPPNSVLPLDETELGQSCLEPSSAVNDNSVHSLPLLEPQKSDEDDPELYWIRIPPSRRSVVRLYLRSQRPSDEVRARELCEEYGFDYEEARARALQGQ